MKQKCNEEEERKSLRNKELQGNCDKCDKHCIEDVYKQRHEYLWTDQWLFAS